MIYKISYVVAGGSHPGAIVNDDRRPRVGERIQLDGVSFEVVEVIDLMPPRGEFAYVHVTCEPVGDTA